MTTDNDMGMFRSKLDELVAGKDTIQDEEVVAKVDELKGMTADLPDSEDKAKLDRFLEDFKAVKDQDEATAKEAAGMVADLFEKLDTAAMQDAPAVEPAAEEPAEEAPQAEPTDAAEEEEESEQAEEIAEETEVPEEKPAEDADPNPAYSLEEIYQFIKKRMAEDACAEEETADEAPEEEVQEEKEEEEVTTDHAPFIPVTMNQQPAAAGTLADLLKKI
jgi:hypothetical protein